MPFHVRDPWRVQYFENIPCPPDVNVPIDDIDCWEWFPDHRHIYDKLHIARSQNVASGTASDMPAEFPVFAKPRVNLKGMGLGSGIITSAGDFRARMTPAQMWMTLFSGRHVSTDCAVVAGKVHWARHATGITWTGGMFQHWIIHGEGDETLEDYLAAWISRELPNYAGMMNIETIGGRIVEVHLRFADQWCDLYGRPWFDSVIALYQHGCWLPAPAPDRTGYSIPLFARHGTVPPYPGADEQNEIRRMPGVASLQITYHENKPGNQHAMPPGGFRLGIVNCWDLQAGFAARRILAEAFPGCAVMLPE